MYFSVFGVVALAIVCIVIYLVDLLFKKLGNRKSKTDEDIKEVFSNINVVIGDTGGIDLTKKYKVVDMKQGMKVLASYDYEADAIIRQREMRAQGFCVMIQVRKD